MKMKGLIFALLAMLFIAGAGAVEPLEIKEITMKLRSTPVPQYDNESSRAKSGSKNRWLQVFVDFVPAAKKAGDAWFDDVTMEGTLVLVRDMKGSANYVVLTGKTRFFTIPADGKEHAGVFYVPPMLLARYCGTANDALKAVRMFRVSFYGPGRVLLGEGYWEVGGKKGRLLSDGSKAYNAAVARMKEYEKPYRNVIFLRGGLYSKEKTPWVYHDYDFYDLIYDNVQLQDGESIRK